MDASQAELDLMQSVADRLAGYVDSLLEHIADEDIPATVYDLQQINESRAESNRLLELVAITESGGE